MGSVHFTEPAAAQLLRWESRYGWTRRGDGWVSARETSLATVLSELLVVPDLWTEVAGHYMDALDRVAEGGRDQRRGRRSRQQRAEALSEWNALLVERLAGSDMRSSSIVLWRIQHWPGQNSRSFRPASHASAANWRLRAPWSSSA